MALSYPTPSANSVPEYQVSGLPYLTSSTGIQTISFPFVSQWIMLRTAGASATLAFTSTGASTGNVFTVPTNTTLGPLNLRVTDLYIVGTTQVIAGLTTVPRDRAFVLASTGSIAALTGSVPATDLNFVSYVGI
jgi:hypothetical protein